MKCKGLPGRARRKHFMDNRRTMTFNELNLSAPLLRMGHAEEKRYYIECRKIIE